MGVFGIFIVLCLILLFYNFTKANNQDIGKIKAQGGIETKYLPLIQYFFSLSPYMKVLSKDQRHMTIGYNLTDGSKSNFFIQISFNKLVIKWSFYTIYTGELKTNWEFVEDYNIDLIISEIDIKLHNMGMHAGLFESDVNTQSIRKLFFELENHFLLHERYSAGTIEVFGVSRMISNWKQSAKEDFKPENFSITKVEFDTVIEDFANTKLTEISSY